MKFRCSQYRSLVLIVTLLTLLQPSLSVSQELVLEEVIVTSQLRTESLQDVSVSVSAVSGTKLMEAGIAKIEDLQAFVPNLTMSETGIGTNIYIRGIGSGINQGFEQSVGMYVDGVYYGRAQLTRAPFLDLERVEVMRGPQNILYGKNSIAGALSVVTAKPREEFEGVISATIEPEYDEQVFDLVLSGGLTDTLSARLAHRSRDFDGYIENIDGGDEPNRDEDTTRLTVVWDVNEKIDATFKVEHGTFDVKGRQIEIVGDNPSLNPALGGLNWGQFLLALNPFSAATNTAATPLSITNNQLDYKRSSNENFSNNTTDNFTLTVNYSRDDYTITSITSHLEYDYEELCDCDFTSANIFFVESNEDYSQFSQEFRITSPAGKEFEWIAGIYYQSSELDFEDNFFTTPTSVLGNVLDRLLPTAFSSDGTLANSVYPAGTGLGSGAAQQLVDIQVPRTFDQETDLFSAFLQATWNIDESNRLTVGGRYSEEEKEATRTLTYTDGSGAVLPYDESFVPNTSMGADYILGAVLQVARHDLEGDRDQGKFAPSITYEYDINSDILTYINWSKGFKSGGYDVRSNVPPVPTQINNPFSSALNVTIPQGSFEYDDEEAESIELGIKSLWLNGALEVNAALFYTEYTDLQVSIYDGVLGFNVGNAAEAETMGLEIDGRWAVSHNLTLSAAIAWLDFEFQDYDNGQCTQRERIVFDASGATGQLFCDFKGKSNQYVADFSGVISADYVQAIGDQLEFRAVLDVEFTTDYNPSQNLDSGIEQDGYEKINLRLSLADQGDVWEVALVGKNLTDEKVITYANDTPLSANLVQSVGYYTFVAPPRTVAIQGSYRF